jgi:S1-C subfamily serine protease
VISSDGAGRAHTLGGLIKAAVAIADSDCGGPLVDSSGTVVGLDTVVGARVRVQQPGAGTGFAIPIDSAMAIVHDIESDTPNPNVLRGQGVILGVAADDSISPRGARVVVVEPLSPAQAAGIAPGDVIVALGGASVESAAALRQALSTRRARDHVTVEWIHPGSRRQSADVQLASGTV